MLQRCYDNKTQEKYPTYKGCQVCEEWHNFQNFAKWFEENYYEVEGENIDIDKDILCKGNKIYSPQTCVLSPHKINSLFVNRKNDRGNYPIGVCKGKNKIKKSCYLSRYNTSEEAFQSYKQAKENYIKQVADEYKDKIPEILYKAMYKYKVNIND